jgi:hypothetical protein
MTGKTKFEQARDEIQEVLKKYGAVLELETTYDGEGIVKIALDYDAPVTVAEVKAVIDDEIPDHDVFPEELTIAEVSLGGGDYTFK